MSDLKSICVYCGSSLGAKPIYAAAARSLAEALVSQGIRLVYGGASIGIMGILADHVLEIGGQVIGVIPKSLAQKEIAHQDLTQLHITHSMHERKLLMADLADGFIALPGGIGTFEELFEIWTWAQLGFHHKPCGVLNTAGYYDTLITFLDHVKDEQFVSAPHRDLLIIEQDPKILLTRYQQYQALQRLPTWIQHDQT